MANAHESADSSDEIPPLAFDSEEELRAVLDRLRDDLGKRLDGQGSAGDPGKDKGKGKAVLESEHDRKLASDLVLKDFYAKMEAIIVQNCTITGLSWSDYQRKKRKGELGKTQPFDENLHQRVLKYQNDLFDAREINARERVDAPARTAQYVDEILRLDSGHAEQMEQARIEVPEEISLSRPRSRKSLGGAGDAPSAAQAQEYYEEGKASLDKLLADVPKLASAAEEARKVALDAANLR
ncbi:hypothetical protein JCM10908_003616 [Rhodotorula pacifica]|uniref:uncharacterized protein n=1 Tax=Rhodotorula pacifica TaxID=1495444 RepID=UPI0031738AB2